MSFDSPGKITSTSTIDECLDRIRYARAAELARTGNYLEAQALLAPNGHIPQSPRELDLLARIAAHEDRVSEARRLWEAALQHEPDNPDYHECLRRLRALPRIIIPFETILECLVWAANVFGIATLLYVFLSRR